MKKIKRTLSLVLALVMLMGMVMVPTGAASKFADAELIENTEAVQITSGIGLFAGTADGNFAPKAPVTRAQMATIIVKMLRGSNFNADAFKGVGVNPFPDTANFEGGWAEGYINACVQLGVVAGYGDGTFKPGRELTTAEAMTMIINALGIDPGEGEWPINYMAKAEALKLYGDLAVKPATNVPLTRDQLAVIVWEGMKYSPAGNSGYSVTVSGKTFTFDNVADAIKAAGVAGLAGVTEVIGEDSLANKVYELKNTSGWITGNAASGEECTVLTRANGEEEYYDVETGVDMLGHYVTVYYQEQYKNDEEPGKTYTIVDESTVVTVSETIDSAKEYKVAFGKNTNEAQNGLLLDSAYAVTKKLSNNMTNAIDGYTPGSAAPKGTYIIADGVIVTYIAPVAVYASYITAVSDIEGEETVSINKAGTISNAEGDDFVAEYKGMAVGDLVTFVKVAKGSDYIYALTKLIPISGVVEKTTKTEINGGYYDTIVIAGKSYPAFEDVETEMGKGTSRNYTGSKLDYEVSKISYGQSYTLYITEDGHYVGFEEGGGAASFEDTVYILGDNIRNEKDIYGKYKLYREARGINMNGEEVRIVIGMTVDANSNRRYDQGTDDAQKIGDMKGGIASGFYTVANSTDSEERKEGIQTLTPYVDFYQVGTPVYAVTSNSPETAYTGMDNVEIIGTDGTTSWASSATQFYTVKYDPNNPATPLEIKREVGVGALSTPMDLKNNPVVLLVERDLSVPTMRNDLLVLVNVVDMSADLGDISWLYASEEQIESPFTTALGMGYTLYDAETGKEREFILADGCTGSFSTAGFYEYKFDSEGMITTITPFNNKDLTSYNAFKFTDKQYPQVADNMGFLGVIRWRMRSQRLGLDMKDSGNTNNIGSHNAPIYDLRDEEEIRKSGFPEITSRQQIIDGLASDPGLVVVLDFFMTDDPSVNQGNIKSMFIKKVVRGTVGLNGVVYAHTEPKVGKNDVMVVRSAGIAQGESMVLECEAVVPAGPGFYRYCVNENGELALVPVYHSSFQGANELKGTTAWHNKIKTATANGDGTYAFVTENGCPDENCPISCAFSDEHSGSFTVDDETIILKADGTHMSAAELQGLVALNDIIVDYSSNAANGSTVGLIVVKSITEKVILNSGACAGVHGAGWTAVSGNITSGGNYYLNEDYSGTLRVQTSEKVTLCLNAHNIVGGLQVSGADVDLINCNVAIEPTANKNITGGVYAVVISDGAKVTLNDAIRCEGVKVEANSTFTMNGGVVSGNEAANGGGVYVAATATFTMNGGAVSDNNATSNGGGVYMEANASFTMSADALISGNTAAGVGGGVYLAGKGFAMNGGSIYNNTATGNGGGLYAQANAEFTMSGNAVISMNIGNDGGGVHINVGKLTMSGNAKIDGNTANGRGGGVAVAGDDSDKSELIMQDNAAITNNLAKHNSWAGGGGVYVNNGTNTIAGGTISGNNTLGFGGGVYVNVGSTTIKGTTITDNKATREGTLTGVNNGTIIIESGEFDGTIRKSAIVKGGKFKADPTQYVDAAYEVKELTGDPNGWKFEVVKKPLGDGPFAFAGILAGNTGNGTTYTLDGDYKATAAITVSGKVVLDLKTATLTAYATEAAGSFITVPSGAELTIRGTGVISGTGTTVTRGILVQRGGKLTMESGTISGFKSADTGVAVCVDGGTFTMDGGNISGNTYTGTNGGYVGVINAGTFTMNAGAVTQSGNSVQARYAGSNMTFNGGTVTGNIQNNGSGTATLNNDFKANGTLQSWSNGKIIINDDVTVREIQQRSSGNITVNGGHVLTNVTMNGANGSINITGGKIDGTLTETNGTLTITGGQFKIADPTNYVDTAAYSVTDLGASAEYRYTVQSSTAG